MRVLKILAYLCLIGFIVDLFYKFFDYKKLQEDLEFMPKKSRFVILLFGVVITLLGTIKGFEIAFNWFFRLLIPVIITSIYFGMQEVDLDEKEEQTKTLH